MPRSGSRALVILGVLAVVAVGAAALSQGIASPPALDPQPAFPVALGEPSRGRLLVEAEVRAQLPQEWRAARMRLARYAEVSASPEVHPDRLVWVVVVEDGPAWHLRVYDAASGGRLITREGSGTTPP